jgi:tetratricopeptide (TPR) repeat protein
MMESSNKDFFISYADTDRTWAEWIAWQLEEAGYSTLLQAWDIRPGSNFVLEMDKAAQNGERTIAVLSPEYLNGSYTQAEWAAAFRRDPTGEQGLLLPIHVRECKHQLTGLLGSIAYIDLVGLDDMSLACEVLLKGVRLERAKPAAQPSIPAGAPHSLPEQPRFPGAFPHVWTVPYQRNPFFTGREEVLKNLYDALRVGKAVAVVQPRALTGLGGIGKTQTAVEYAYRYYSDYPEAIFWARADSREGLVTDFGAMAQALHLPEEVEQDQNLVIDAVKRWLKEHANWLLILDNVEDLAMIKSVLPSAYRGHILLTTRMQATGEVARGVEMEQMEPEEGTLLLLRRASILAPDALLNTASEADKAKAREISQVVDGLPLALDQAGAYIEETGCSLSDYLDFFEQRRVKLLKRRGPPSSDHPESVATTWSLSFEKVEQANPAAAELLRFCAFLYPDAIPEEVITEGAPALGSIIAAIATDLPELNEAIGMLLRFSLVRRNRNTKSLSIHRLVQAVLKEEMGKESLHLWAERTVRAVMRTLPIVDYTQWLTIAPRWQRCLPQTLACAKLINQEQMWDGETAGFLYMIGYYLYLCVQYTEAEPLLRNALSISVQVLGPEHNGTCQCLNVLGMICEAQGRYEEAEQFHRRALSIWEKTFGPKDPHVATCLNNIAFVYLHQGKYAEAEVLSKQSLAIREQVLGPDHLDVAFNFKILGELYYAQGKYTEAEAAFRRVLTIRERILGPDHPWVAESLKSLGLIYHEQGKYTEAEALYLRALAIREQASARGNTSLAMYLSNLGLIYHEQGKYIQAEALYLRALSIVGQTTFRETLNDAISFNNLAKLYHDQGRYAEAEPLYQKMLAILEQDPQSIEPLVGQLRGNFAKLYHDQGKYAEAEPLYISALAIWKQHQLMNRKWATFMKNIAAFYFEQGRFAEAEPLYQQALAICEHVLGTEDPDVANILENYASLLRNTKREAEAAEFEARIKAIRAKVQG